MTKKALILIDLQNDFCAGGSLAAPDADAVIPVANQLQPRFDLVVATQDWHPRNHISFVATHPGRVVGDIVEVNHVTQVLWPTHCVQHTKGAELHPELDKEHIRKFIYKGTDSGIDSYSAFFDNAHSRATGLADYLREHEVEEVYIVGLVTEYCVKFSAIDAVKEGFKTTVILDGCRGVNIHPDDVPAAIREMREQGIRLISSEELTFKPGIASPNL